nr:PREDICTED: uncharacterized protein LOC108194955 [Daucus carota subsp. sativus]
MSSSSREMAEPPRKRGRPRIAVTEEVVEARRQAKQQRNSRRVRGANASPGSSAAAGSQQSTAATAAHDQGNGIADSSSTLVVGATTSVPRVPQQGQLLNILHSHRPFHLIFAGPHVETPRQRGYINKKKKDYGNIILDIGPQNQVCGCCEALVWAVEFTGRHVGTGPKPYSICCAKGKVLLPQLQPTPQELFHLLTGTHREEKIFRDNIRMYNNIFAFCSFGGRVDESINDGSGPYVFRVSDHIYHSMGSLLPPQGRTPKYAQFYMYDGQEAIDHRMKFPRQKNALNPQVVAILLQMLNRENALVGIYRQIRERWPASEQIPVRLRLLERRTTDGRFVNLPGVNDYEFAGLAVDHDLATNRDIVVHYKEGGLERISELHPCFMSLQYPLLFPRGEDGYRLGIKHRSVGRLLQHDYNEIYGDEDSSGDNGISGENKGNTVSMREFQAFRLQNRATEGHTLLFGGRLFLQYVVDAWCCIERSRLKWVERHQSIIRSDLYKNIVDSVSHGDISAADVGKRVVLPSSFTGGYRYMQQNFQDSLALCREYGHPDLFITFTCNPKWVEIQRAVADAGCGDASVRPDLVARVFKMKLDAMMSDLMKKHALGRAIAAVYTIEFQKRGLPHAHIVLWLADGDKLLSSDEIDLVISAEIPDKEVDPIGYEVVAQLMMHGLCGEANPSCPCMFNGKCMKYYPRPYASNTTMDSDGYALYRRRDLGRTVECNNIHLDNRHVVPYNRGLLVKYQAHINVERCNRSQSIKYLFKYIGKGPDKATVVLEPSNGSSQGPDVTAHAAQQRLFFHLEDEQEVRFRDDESLPQVLGRYKPDATMFIQWLLNNRRDESGRDLTFSRYPTRYRWDSAGKFWARRRQNVNVVGRMVYAHPASGERFYMRLLLNLVAGATTFEAIRTVDGIIYPTYREACFHRGLLESDNEWHVALDDASSYATAPHLRELFVTMLLFCEVSDPSALWDRHWSDLADDVEYNQRKLLHLPTLMLSDLDKQTLALEAINNLLNQHGKSLADFPGLPEIDKGTTYKFSNRLVLEEMMYDCQALEIDATERIGRLNSMQHLIFEKVVQSVNSCSGGFYFVYGHGGTGKTFLWSTIICKLRSEGHIVLAVATSGIASLLIEGGRTAHSRFRIPIDINESSTCEIRKNTHLAELICKASLVIWDEAPMTHRFIFEAVDRTFRDVRGIVNPNAKNLPFGGLTVVLGGDFRQVLPVVPKEGREGIVAASISKSYLWQECKGFTLVENMRVQRNIPPITLDGKVMDFRDWILDIGNGVQQTYDLAGNGDSSWIKIPKEKTIIYTWQSPLTYTVSLLQLQVSYSGDPIKAIVNEIYGGLEERHSSIDYLRERAILTPLNEYVDKINREVLSRLPDTPAVYKSSDSVCKGSSGNAFDDILYPPEYLNSLKFSGVPNHELQLKVGTPIMILRNLNPKKGLCNGTRLIVTRCYKFLLEALIITGNKIGEKTYIPRICMTPADKTLPFTLKRKQFPIGICYAMTINKSQGQTMKHVGLFLPDPAFSHGQIYVAISRVTSPTGLRILCVNEDDRYAGYTKNVVYHEIFNDIVPIDPTHTEPFTASS